MDDDNVSSDPIGLIQFLTRNLVESTQEVTVNPIVGSHSLVLEVRLNPDEVGKVVGRGGRIARAIRTLLHSIQNKSYVVNGNRERFYRIDLEIVD